METRCRVCSRTEPFESVPLSFRPEASHQETISGMFTYCTQLEVSPDDLLPQKVCSDCLKNLTGAFEFKQLCHQSDASFRQMLREESRDEVPLATSTKTDAETDGPTPMATYQCCFKRCDRKTTDYAKLRDHAKKNHPTRRNGNARRRREDHRFVCAICLGGFGNRTEWNMHRALLRGVQRFQCTRCSESFRTEEELETHLAVGRCRQQEREADEDVSTDATLTSLQQYLIRRILRAKATDGLVRLSEKEYDAVLEDKAAFLERLHRNEFKNSRKRVKLFYVCGACNFRTEIRDEVVTHLEIGSCLQGFYMAFGFRAVRLRRVQSLECKTCRYRTESTGNFNRHQRIHNHSGIRKSRITKPVAEREYPCEYCGRVLTTCNNRKRHRSKCLLRKAGKTVANEAKEPPGIEDVTLDDQLGDSDTEDTASQEDCEIQPEPLSTVLKIEEYDPLEAINQAESDQQQETELPTNEVHQPPDDNIVMLSCKICNYSTNKRGNLNRHVKSCFMKVSPDAPPILPSTCSQQFYECTRCHESFSSEKHLAAHMASGACQQQQKELEDKVIETPLATPWQDLIRRILKAKATNGLVRLNEQEYDAVLNSKAALLRQLHRKGLTHLSRRVKLFYVCEACNFRTEIRDEVVTHLDVTTCGQGFYAALGCRMLKMRCMYVFECKMCDFRSEDTDNMKHHHLSRNHSGIRKTKIAKQVAEREYPCEFCGRVSSTSSNRLRHRRTCSRAAGKTIPNEAKERTEDVTMIHDQSQTFEDTASKEECEEQRGTTLLTEFKIEEYDPLEAMNQGEERDQEKDTELPAKEVKQTKKLYCQICGYCTNIRGNLNRHLKKCLLKVSPKVPSIHSSTEEHLPMHMDSGRCRQQQEEEDTELPTKEVKQSKNLNCQICGYTTNIRGNLNRHLKRCLMKVSAEEHLATHIDAQDEEEQEDKSIVTLLASPWQDLIRRILTVKATNGLVRLSEQEYETVLDNKSAFLKHLHRNELKHSSKQVKLFYVCEACNFRTEIRGEVLTHLDIGTCVQGFYTALGFRRLKLRCIYVFECEMCDFRSENNTGNIKRHQLRLNHSGIRKTKIVKQLAEKEYPCEYCGRVLTSSNNRNRHRRTCSRAAVKTTSNQAKEPLSTKYVTMYDQSQTAEDTASKEECEEQRASLVTEFKIEEYDPLEAINQAESDQEQETELSTTEVNESTGGITMLSCEICGYTTNKRGNLNRHLKKCLMKASSMVPPIQSSIPLERLHECTHCHESFATEEQLATHIALEGCRQQQEKDQEEDKAIDTPLASPWQDLIRRILKAKSTNGLERLSEQEYETVLDNKSAFLKHLHRNELKHSSKQVKLFYVCEACNFRTEIRDEVVTHLETGTCVKGFYKALGFRVENLRSVIRFECQMCDFRSEHNTGNIKRHQLRRNHSGIRKIKIAKPLAEREYPCEFCGRVLTTSSNRLRHRRTCSLAAGKTISKRIPKAVAEPPTTKVKQHRTRRLSGDNTMLECKICGYTTDKRGNLNRHLKTCLMKVPPKQSTYFSSSDSE